MEKKNAKLKLAKKILAKFTHTNLIPSLEINIIKQMNQIYSKKIEKSLMYVERKFHIYLI